MREYRKKRQVEDEIGCPVAEFVQRSAGLSQAQIAKIMKVQPITLGRWMEADGIEQVITYRKRAR